MLARLCSSLRCRVATTTLMPCCWLVSFPASWLVKPSDPGMTPSLLAGRRTKLCLCKVRRHYPETLNCVGVFVSVTECRQLCVVFQRPVQTVARLHPEAAVIDAPAKISARDAVMENEWMDEYLKTCGVYMLEIPQMECWYAGATADAAAL